MPITAPNARSVLAALKRIAPLDIKLIATGHGPLLKESISHWLGQYQSWSAAQAKTDTLVVCCYCQDYGHSDHLARAIAHGVNRNGVQGDHWVIYSLVHSGRVADVHGLTAVHHRKLGSHY